MEGGVLTRAQSNPNEKESTVAQKRFNLPSDEVGEIEEEIKDKTPQHKINKKAAIIGAVCVVALLILATR